jgi:hypothetical protein
LCCSFTMGLELLNACRTFFFSFIRNQNSGLSEKKKPTQNSITLVNYLVKKFGFTSEDWRSFLMTTLLLDILLLDMSFFFLFGYPHILLKNKISFVRGSWLSLSINTFPRDQTRVLTLAGI